MIETASPVVDTDEMRNFDSEFLTPRGMKNYLDSVAAASRKVVDALGATTRPGLVDGSPALRELLAQVRFASERGIGLDAALDEVATMVVPNSTMVADPNYTAHLHCPPMVASLAAEVVLSALNQSMDSFDQAPAATVVEELVIEWLCELVGYGPEGDGVFTSGGTMSNLQGLLLARDNYAHRMLGWDIGNRGLPAEARQWRILCTADTHFTVGQAARMLGLGTQAIVPVDTDADGRLDPVALQATIMSCAEAGQPVIAIVANAGTTGFGVIDPLAQVCAIGREWGIWVHIDACAAGCLLLSEQHRSLLTGIDGADSLAIDFHKLAFQAISACALLVRNSASLSVMAGHADYLNPIDDDPDQTPNLVTKSLQTTRRFDALKLWITLRALGMDVLGAMVDATVAAARAAELAASEVTDLWVVGSAVTNTVVLRWEPPGMSAEELDTLNDAIRRTLVRQERALIGRSRVAGMTVLKLTFVNPVCTIAAARALVAEIAECGRKLIPATEEMTG